MTTKAKTIYDHPLYYDILFGWDRSFECAFYQHCFEHHGVGRDEPVLELACGTGRVALLLAHHGWRVTGLDLSPAMLAFLEDRCSAERLDVETVCGDMTSFELESSFAAAFNPLSSFRLLQTDADVNAHFRAVAASLREEGIYVLDLEFVERSSSPQKTTSEDWEMSRAGVTVTATNDAVHVDDGGVRRVLAWGDGVHLRDYTPSTFMERVDVAGKFRLEGWYPEVGRVTGVTQFATASAGDTPGVGRGMIVLRRC